MTTATAGSLAPARTISTAMTFLLASACGLVAANLYYAQPIAGPIAAAVGLPSAAAGLIVTLTQVGYGLGLLLVVPLADLAENRRLVVTLVGLAGCGLVAAGLSHQAWSFLFSALLIGVVSVAVQVLVPFAAHLAPDATRGRVVGNVMSGLLLGIMLARPVSSFVAGAGSWRAVFFLSAGAMAVLALALHRLLPVRRPPASLSYGTLLLSMMRLATVPVLRRRGLYHACLFASFSLFWTTVPLFLAGPAFGLSQPAIALFALAGVAGVIGSPIGGRVADRGWTRPATAAAMLLVGAAFLVPHLTAEGSSLSLGLLVAAALLLDLGVSINVTLGQRAIFALAPEIRGRLNGLYMAAFFAGGALGSALGGWAYAAGGWRLASWLGLAFPLLALACFATERGEPAMPRQP